MSNPGPADLQDWTLRRLTDWTPGPTLRRALNSKRRRELAELLPELEIRGLIQSRRIMRLDGYPEIQYRALVKARIALRQPEFPAVKDPYWRDGAACYGVDPEIFFPIGGHSTTSGPKSICARCSVRDDCLTHALRTNQDYGVWGGLDVTERRKLRAAIMRGEP